MAMDIHAPLGHLDIHMPLGWTPRCQQAIPLPRTLGPMVVSIQRLSVVFRDRPSRDRPRSFKLARMIIRPSRTMVHVSALLIEL